MFNAEKLLSKVISEMAGSVPDELGGKHIKKYTKKQKKKYKKEKKYKKKSQKYQKYQEHPKERKAKTVSDSLVSSLTSGKGLMAAVALGVGAFTIYKGSQNSSPAAPGMQPPATPTFPAKTGTGQAAPPPLPGNRVQQPVEVEPQQPISPPSPQEEQPGNAADINALAVRLIQVMIAAAWADGDLDQEEETQILQQLQGQELDSEEKAFLLRELHTPQSIAQLCDGINDPSVAQTMYSLAVATLVIDTEAERNWLDELTQALSISQEMQSFIEEEL